MRVLHVASEVYPLIKTGGLADVAAALPAALMRIGVDARILVPGYPAVLEKMPDLRHVRTHRRSLDHRRHRPDEGQDARRRALLRDRCAGDVRQTGQPLSGAGRQGLAGQPLPLRAAELGRRMVRRRRRRLALAAGRGPRPRLAGGAGFGLPDAGRRPAPRHRPDHPQHRLSGAFPRQPAGSASTSRHPASR